MLPDIDIFFITHCALLFWECDIQRTMYCVYFMWLLIVNRIYDMPINLRNQHSIIFLSIFFILRLNADTAAAAVSQFIHKRIS